MPSPTEVMISTMEEFGNAEPSDLLILFIAADGMLYYRSTIDSTCLKVGMLEMARQIITRKCFGEIRES